MKTNHFRKIATLGAIVGLASSVSAAVSLVYTGTVGLDATGTYSPGTAISLTFTFSSEVGAGSDQFTSDAGSNNWGTENIIEASTWATVTSASLGGTWAEGAFDPDGPRDNLNISDVGASDLLAFSTAIDNGSSVGLTLGGNDVTSIQVSGLLNGFDATFDLGGYTDPSTYLTTFAGVYTATGLAGTIETSGGDLTINGASLEIVAIPEPGQLALLIGFGASFVLIRRRR